MKRLAWLSLVTTLLVAVSDAQEFRRLRGAVPSGATYRASLAVDIDRDGDVDIVSGGSGGASLHVLENDGRGRFRLHKVGTAGFGPNDELSVANLDGRDGLDLLHQRPNRIDVYRNDGVNDRGIAFQLVVGSTPSLTGYHAHDVADVDGDGDDDLYVTATLRSPFPRPLGMLLVNDGDGFFSNASANLPVVRFDDYARFVDYDSDGAPDVLTGGSSPVLRNDGNGVFSVVPVSAPSASNVHVRDVDGDGDEDLVKVSSDLAWWPNDGGRFVRRLSITMPTGFHAFGDVTGDGREDVIVKDPTDLFTELSRGLHLYRQLADGAFVFEPTASLDGIDAEVLGAALADLDGDGDTDTFVYAGRSTVLWNAGDASFETGLAGPEELLTSLDAVRVADLDGDGALDAMVRTADTFNGARMGVIANDGTGRFAPFAALAPSVGGPGFALPDADGDGRPELLVVRRSSIALLALYANDGAGGFTPSTAALPSIAGVVADSADPEVGDLDGDGVDDVLLVIESDTSTLIDRLLLGDGLGGFVDATARLSIPNSSEACELGDLDGDGTLDAVFLTDIVGSAVLGTYLNPGDGGFTIETQALRLGGTDFDFALADMDDDGALDLLVASRNASPLLRIFAGDGAGSFALTPVATLTRVASSNGVGRVVTLDADGDGLLDAFVTDGSLWRNRGGFAFDSVSAVPSTDVAAHAFEAGAGDFDRDGDADLWMAGASQIHWNVRRQLARRHWPAVGKALTFELFGSPGALFGLWGSLALAAVPTPYGLLRIDLSQGSRVAVGLLDSSGRGGVTLVVPLDPALLGTSVHWQALIGTPLEFGNVESTVLGGA